MDVNKKKSVLKTEEEILRKSEERFRRIVESSPVAKYFYQLEEDGHLILTGANPSADRLLGINHQPLIGKSIEEAFPQIAGTEIPLMYRSVAIGELGPQSFEFPYRDNRFSVFLEVTVFQTGDNEIAVDFVDITERIQSQEKLRESEDKWRKSEQMLNHVLEHFPGVVFWKDTYSNYLGCNQAFAKGAGLQRVSDIIQKTDFDLPWATTEAEHYRADDKRVLESGEAKLHIIEMQHQIDGQILWLDTSKIPVRDKNGIIIGLLGVSTDITERKNAEEKMRESEHKFRSLFENMTEGVALHEMIYKDETAIDYRILDINPAYEKHTGLLQTTARGLLASVLYGSVAPPYFNEFAAVAHTGIPYIFETYFQPLDRYFHISVFSPAKGFFATVFEDITDRKRKEKEVNEKNAELERFTYTVSHDLKSPLITIKGFSGGLLNDLSIGRHDRFESDLKRIADAANKMHELLEDLLELSRIGRVVNPAADFPLEGVIRDVVSLLYGPITEGNVKVLIQEGLPLVHGDRRRIAEVFQNLVENSLKFFDNQSEPHIEIGARDIDEEKIFYVRDNGKGIDPKYHETIFGLFNKLDASTKGTGIGLALARRIIEVHGGKIWVESDGAQCGTTFYFTIPTPKFTRKEKK